MSSSYTSQKLKVYSSKAFRDSFKETTPKRIGYIFLSKSSEYPDENTVTNVVDTVSQEKQIWDDMLLAKKVIPKDVEFVIPRYNWTPGARYKQYDDTVPLETLLTESVEGDEIIYPMYVMNADGDVYKCLCNNVNQVSQVEPIGNFTENDGFIQTETGESSCYLWKYMYNVKRTNKFLTDEWMPIPYIQANTDFTSYNYNSSSAIEGSLNKITVTNGGSNYFHTTLNVSPFLAGATELTILDDIDLTTSNTINVNMLISGTGIFENETYITEINPTKPKTLILSEPTISSGGGNTTANLISVLTRVVIDGDGTETVTTVRLDTTNNTVKKIDVVNAGINYTKANVIIYGSGTGATARAVLPPKFGHGYNPAIEFGASNVMIVSRIGEIDATENNIIPTDINFRQYGLLVNAYKYNDTQPINETNSLDVVSQTLDLTLLSFSNFTIGEKVYQGNVNDPSFIGYVVYQDSNVVKLNSVYKEPTLGSLLIGSQSGSRNSVIAIKNPDLKPYAGDILFARNILRVQRSIAQAEEVKLVFQF
jgi:hypothetical protein